MKNKYDKGSVFQMQTDKGFGYFRCVKIDKRLGDWIQVFGKVFDNEVKDINELETVSNVFFVRFSVSIAYKKELIKKIGDFYTPSITFPLFTRVKHIIKGEFIGWYIIDTITYKRILVEKLNDEQLRLSPNFLVNIESLTEMIDTNFNLKNWL